MRGTATPDDAASPNGLTGALATFLAVFSGRMHASEEKGHGPQLSGDAGQSDAWHPDFAEIEAPEGDTATDGGAENPTPAVPVASLPVLPDQKTVETARSLKADIIGPGESSETRMPVPQSPATDHARAVAPASPIAAPAPETGPVRPPGPMPQEHPGSVASDIQHAGRTAADRNPVPDPVLRPDPRPSEIPAAPSLRPQETGGGTVQVSVAGQTGSGMQMAGAPVAQRSPAAPLEGLGSAPRPETRRQPDRNLPNSPIIVEPALSAPPARGRAGQRRCRVAKRARCCRGTQAHRSRSDGGHAAPG